MVSDLSGVSINILVWQMTNMLFVHFFFPNYQGQIPNLEESNTST